jgi:hypothetical protein
MIQYNDQPKPKYRFVVERGPEGWEVTLTHNQNPGSFTEIHFEGGTVQRIIMWSVGEEHARRKAREVTKALFQIEEEWLV